MSVRLKFPRGGSFSFTRQFKANGSALDVTGATLTGRLKYSADDADAAAVAALTITVVDASVGAIIVTVPAAATANLPRGVAYYWQVQADLGSANLIRPESLHGSVVLTPVDGMLAGLLCDCDAETLTPDDGGALVSVAGIFVINRPDITDLTGTGTTLDAILHTAYPVTTVVLLSYGGATQFFQFFAGTVVEAPTDTPALVVCNSNSAFYWKQIG